MNVLLVATIVILRLLAITPMDYLHVLVTMDTVAQGLIVKVAVFCMKGFCTRKHIRNCLLIRHASSISKLIFLRVFTSVKSVEVSFSCCFILNA